MFQDLRSRDIPELPFALDLYSRSCALAGIQQAGDGCADAQRQWVRAMHGALPRGRYSTGTRDSPATSRPTRTISIASLPPAPGFRGAGGRPSLYRQPHRSSRYRAVLDHRETRALVGRLARRQAVLNLFCYTRLQCLRRRASRFHDQRRPVRTYLDWARRSFELNSVDRGATGWGKPMSCDFSKRNAVRKDRYELIVLDP